MPQLDQKGRILAAQYRFINCLSCPSITTNIDGANADQVRQFCTCLKKRYPNTLSRELVDIIGQKKRRGDMTRVRSGSNASLKIREVL